MRTLPVGVDDFKKLRASGAYYVDKSLLIDDILSRPSTEVFLYTRPRRFGKSLNLSMVDAFLNSRYGNQAKEWFSGLAIEGLHDDEMGSCEVIHVDLKDMKGDTYRKIEDSYDEIVQLLYGDFDYLRDSERLNPVLRRKYAEIADGRARRAAMDNAILYLCKMLHAYHGRKPVVLIDEYDSAVNKSYGRPYQRKVLDLVCDILSPTLKGNDSLRFAVVTGVMQIAQESVFSGLNNFLANSIFSTVSDERFGFTEFNVWNLCKDLGHPERMDEVRDWYDGYRFGNVDVYNPWSIIAYADLGFVTDRYWAGTSRNSIIDDLLSRADAETCLKLTNIGDNKPVVTGLSSRVTYDDISKGTSAIYSILAMSGYLRAVPLGSGNYEVSVPNMEMNSVFATHILGSLDSRLPDLASPVVTSLLGGMSEELETNLRRFMEVYDFKNLGKEHSYQFVVGTILASACFTHKVVFEGMGGDGYYDLLARSIRADKPSVLIEFKALGSRAKDETMRSTASRALKQIHEKRYAEGLDNVLLYGMAFRGKNVAVTIDHSLSQQ